MAHSVCHLTPTKRGHRNQSEGGKEANTEGILIVQEHQRPQNSRGNTKKALSPLVILAFRILSASLPACMNG